MSKTTHFQAIATFIVVKMLFFGLITLLPVQAEERLSLQEGLHLGNSAYGQGRYQEAIELYSTLIGEYGLSPELLHNLANSCAGAGERGRAILHYLQGLRIAPGDDDLLADLQLIRKEVGLFDQEPQSAALFGYYDMNQWLIRALFFFVLFTLLLGVNLCFPLKKRIYPLGALMVGTALFCCVAAYTQNEAWHSGVIVAPDTRLLLSPFQESASNGTLNEGAVVFTEKSHEGYLYIRDRRGRAGWINSSAYIQINTSAATFGPGSVAPDLSRL